MFWWNIIPAKVYFKSFTRQRRLCRWFRRCKTHYYLRLRQCWSKQLSSNVYSFLYFENGWTSKIFVYRFLTDQKIIYSKQPAFQKGNTTDHTFGQLVDQISAAFYQNKYTLGARIDLFKAFDTVNHHILQSNLELCGIRGKYLKWPQSYVGNRMQYIQINSLENTLFKSVRYIIPQGSLLGPLLFLLYVNHLKSASKLLYSIMFADDTNLLYSNENVDNLFATVNKELWNNE